MLQKHPLLGPLLEAHRPVLPTPQTHLHHYLCSSILSQQLSTAVAKIIHQRFLNLYGGDKPAPEQILATAPETLRSIGLSHAKVGYVQNVARYALENNMSDAQLYAMSDEEVIAFLTQIKGVGRWTVEMMLMFGMGRPDVFAPDDLGIQKSMIQLFGLAEDNKKELRRNMIALAEEWRPERSLACLVLWKMRG